MIEIKTLKNKIGKVPLCNGKPERAPHIGNFCLPLCWRCCSFIAGCWMMCVANTTFFIMNPYLGLIISLLLVAPCLFDGILQYRFGYISTNLRRAITGLLAGVGLVTISDAFFGLSCLLQSQTMSTIIINQKSCNLANIKLRRFFFQLK